MKTACVAINWELYGLMGSWIPWYADWLGAIASRISSSGGRFPFDDDDFVEDVMELNHQIRSRALRLKLVTERLKRAKRRLTERGRPAFRLSAEYAPKLKPTDREKMPWE
jgi:hypothetical protein